MRAPALAAHWRAVLFAVLATAAGTPLVVDHLHGLPSTTAASTSATEPTSPVRSASPAVTTTATAARPSDLPVSSTTSSSPTEAEAEVEPTTSSHSEQEDCTSQIGTIQNGVPVNTMPKYDVARILEDHGGAPGKHNATWNQNVPEFPVEDPSERPLPDTDNGTFWLYDYRLSDLKTFIRLEHALLRRKGQPEEYTDIRGEIYWTPPDFCGRVRHANYRSDPEGFFASVTLEYCDIGSDTLSCAMPASCQSNETYIACVAAPSSALLASLVG